jgi:hypothetical protein
MRWMNAPARLTIFALGLAAVAGGAALVGAATDAGPPGGSATGGGHGGGEDMAAMASPGNDGTRLSAGGLTLEPSTMTVGSGRTRRWAFRVLDQAGNAVRAFQPEQTKLLHLIVVRSDLTGFQHLHPELGRDGTFATELRLARPGRYRAIADFTTEDGERHVLGTDLLAPGAAAEVPMPPPSATASVDGYEVALDRPEEVLAGDEADLSFSVSRDGRPVTGLQPYLGASGHLVAVHGPSIAYSHVHPTEEDLDEGSIGFGAELHEPGTYRLFLQFRTGGRVHTAEFTLEAGSAR